MADKRKPFCSIVVLNYNGEQVITNTINSLLNLNYPKGRYEILIVDNHSRDKSREMVKELAERHARVRTIFLEENLGFARGNNVGMREARGDYVALLNNDCVAEEGWLSQLVDTAEKEEKVFAVASKILFYPKYLYLKLDLPATLSLGEPSLSKSRLLEFGKKSALPLKMQFKEDSYLIELPLDPLEDEEVVFDIPFIESGQRGDKGKLPSFSLLGIDKKYYQVSQHRGPGGNNVLRVRLSFLRGEVFKKSFVSKIQNAGIIPFSNGGGRDIGAVVRRGTQDYEKDVGQYEREREVYAACGAAPLYRKSVLDKIGFFDNSMFMYYEDVDLSERARLSGYKIRYCPRAVVRHLHAYSSSEGSPFFLYHTRKGRLLHLFYNFPFEVFLREFSNAFFGLWFFGARDLWKILRGPESSGGETLNQEGTEEDSHPEGVLVDKAGKLKIHLKVLSFFLINGPFLALKRLRRLGLLKRKSVQKNYQEILEGRWYFD
jgi:GT2 family glycosyltransferase